jgi:hypothetical protein
MNTFVKLLILMNILNVIDAIQTYYCVNYFVCVDFNPFVNHAWFYVVKILSGVGVSGFYYYAYTRFNNYNKKLTYYLVVFTVMLYTLVVLSNMLHFIRVFC